MGLGMMIKRGAGTVKFFCKEHSPEIKFALGVVSFVGTCVSVYKTAPKYEKVLEEYRKAEKDRLAAIEKDDAEGGKRYSKEDRKIDKRANRLKLFIETVKCWWKPIGLGIMSVTLFGKSLGDYKRRYLGLAEAYTALSMKEDAKEALETAEGEAEEGSSEEKAAQTDDESYKEATVKIFSKKTCPGSWSDDLASNRFFLESKRKWVQAKLDADGFVFLNYALDMIGLEQTEAGQVLGWKRYKETTEALKYGGQNCVIFDYELVPARHEGEEPYIIIRFNCDKAPLIGRSGLKKR